MQIWKLSQNDDTVTDVSREYGGGGLPADEIFPPDDLANVSDIRYIKHIGMEVMMRSQEEIDAIIALDDLAYQNAKPLEIKQIDNLYVDFLTRIWTGILRTAGIVAPDYTVTVENTNSATNVGYLMTLRALNYTAYIQMSSEFINFKTVIEGAGYDLARVKVHVI